jgi:hypothetical protein
MCRIVYDVRILRFYFSFISVNRNTLGLYIFVGCHRMSENLGVKLHKFRCKFLVNRSTFNDILKIYIFIFNKLISIGFHFWAFPKVLFVVVVLHFITCSKRFQMKMCFIVQFLMSSKVWTRSIKITSQECPFWEVTMTKWSPLLSSVHDTSVRVIGNSKLKTRMCTNFAENIRLFLQHFFLVSCRRCQEREITIPGTGG